VMANVQNFDLRWPMRYFVNSRFSYGWSSAHRPNVLDHYQSYVLLTKYLLHLAYAGSEHNPQRLRLILLGEEL
jgi:hypothetical protein